MASSSVRHQQHMFVLLQDSRVYAFAVLRWIGTLGSFHFAQQQQ
jgi:hypothetical protein